MTANDSNVQVEFPHTRCFSALHRGRGLVTRQYKVQLTRKTLWWQLTTDQPGEFTLDLMNSLKTALRINSRFIFERVAVVLAKIKNWGSKIRFLFLLPN